MNLRKLNQKILNRVENYILHWQLKVVINCMDRIVNIYNDLRPKLSQKSQELVDTYIAQSYSVAEQIETIEDYEKTK